MLNHRVEQTGPNTFVYRYEDENGKTVDDSEYATAAEAVAAMNEQTKDLGPRPARPAGTAGAVPAIPAEPAAEAGTASSG